MPTAMANNLSRRNSSIHKICEFPLPKLNLSEEYDIIHTLGEGWFAKIILAEHRRTRAEVVLKAISKDATSRREFFREFHYSYYLSPHPSVLNTYDVAFESERYFFFAQELASFGDLTSNVADNGLGEVYAKRAMNQVAAALDFIHSKDLVHRDLKMDNILVFTNDFSVVKLADFGSTRRVGTLVRRRHELLAYCPPEVAQAVYNEGYHVAKSQDVWQFGVLLFVLLTGALPWQKADETTDRLYDTFCAWQQRRTSKIPPKFKEFSARLQRLFKRLLDPKQETRVSIKEYFKYADDKWLAKRSSPSWLGVSSRDQRKDDYTEDLSMRSAHSCPEEKNLILRTLTQFGIETTVDRTAKRQRITEWIQSSKVYRQRAENQSSN